MVDNQNIGPGRLPPRFVKEAPAVILTAHPRTLIRLTTDLFPGLITGDKGEVLFGTIGGRFRPLEDLLNLVNLFLIEQAQLAPGILTAAPAELIAAAFNQNCMKFDIGRPLQKWQVFADQLFL